jgi:hypothetical protein
MIAITPMSSRRSQVNTPDDNANLSANSRKQGRVWPSMLALAVDGPGLRRSREMATIGKLETMPSVRFNVWRQ